MTLTVLENEPQLMNHKQSLTPRQSKDATLKQRSGNRRGSALQRAPAGLSRHHKSSAADDDSHAAHVNNLQVYLTRILSNDLSSETTPGNGSPIKMR